MLKNYLIFSLVISLWGVSAYASEVSFRASAPQQVGVGERFRIVFELNERPDNFVPPNFEEFQVLAGPSQSSSTSTQIINNQVTTTSSFSYTYVIQAVKEGSYSVGPAKATIKGKIYESNPLKIQVSDQPSNNGKNDDTNEQGKGIPSTASDKDIFVRAAVSNSSPYQSEQVIVAYKIFTRIPVSQYSIERIPSYQGFWSENLSGSDQGNTTTEVIDGISYRVAEVRRVALFPQRSGEITIEPIEINAVVRIPGQRRRESIFDEFFGGSPFDAFQNVQQIIRSNPVVLKVKPLPTENRPAEFNGFVGNLDVSAQLKPTELNVNEASNLIIKINGRGNLKMLETPKINFPSDLEAFDPNITDNINNSASGVNGSREINYTIIPRNGGDFEIPPVILAFFDPATGKYITKSTEPFSLKVIGGSSGEGGLVNLDSRVQMQTIGSDIRFIVTKPITLRPLGSMFYGSSLFFALLTLPWLLFGAGLIYWRQQLILRTNKALKRTRQAEKISRRRLKKAFLYLKADNRNAFFEEISRSLLGYIGDKLNIPPSNLNREQINQILHEKNIPEHLAERFMEALDDCEYARFAPGSSHTMMDETYQKTLATVISLEKELRKKS